MFKNSLNLDIKELKSLKILILYSLQAKLFRFLYKFMCINV